MLAASQVCRRVYGQCLLYRCSPRPLLVCLLVFLLLGPGEGLHARHQQYGSSLLVTNVEQDKGAVEWFQRDTFKVPQAAPALNASMVQNRTQKITMHATGISDGEPD